jgi:nicotinamidase-related amidase
VNRSFISKSLIDFELQTRSTFEANKDLAKRLKDEGVEEVIGVGIQSDYCVRATLSSALEEGFQVKLLKGAHSTYDDDGKKAEDIEREIEKELEGKGAKVVEWEDWKP